MYWLIGYQIIEKRISCSHSNGVYLDAYTWFSVVFLYFKIYL